MVVKVVEGEGEGAVFWVNVGHPIVTNGDFVTLLCESAWTDQAVVCGAGVKWSQPRDGCIRWGFTSGKGNGSFWGFSPNKFEWRF